MPIEDIVSSDFNEHTDDALELANFANASRRLQESRGGDILHNESMTETGTTVITPSAELQQLHEKKIVPNKKRIVGATAALAAGLVITPAVVDALAPPEFSEETKTVIVEDGDGTQSLLEKADIAGYNNADWRDVADHVTNLPENKDVFEDGLQQGETVSVPISIK